MTPTPTCIIGSVRLFREGLKSLLSNLPYEVIAMGADLGDLAESLPPDLEAKLLLVGSSGDDEKDSVELSEARARFPDSRIVMLTSTANQRHFSECLAAGVDGYLLTDISREVLVDSLRLVFLGEKVFPTILAAWIVADGRETPASAPVDGGKNLSPRELEILHLLIDGASNKCIAKRLGIADATVKVHLRKILKKLNASNRTQAAVWAVNRGLVAGRRPAEADESGSQLRSKLGSLRRG